MDEAGGGKSGPGSHLETTTSFKRRSHLQPCDFTAESLATAAIRVPRVLDIYDAVAAKKVLPPRESTSSGGRRKKESVYNKEKCSISQSSFNLECMHVTSQYFGCLSLQLLSIKFWN